MKLADQAYWLVQDDWTAELRTSQRAADVIVAAAVLADLVGARAIAVYAEAVRVASTLPALDELGCDVVAQIVAEPGIRCAEVIDGLAPTIRGRVARRMIRACDADARRVGWRRRRWAVARSRDNSPAWVRANLVLKLERGLDLSVPERVLVRLVAHSSMAGNPLSDLPPGRAAAVLSRARDPELLVYQPLLDAATDAIRLAAIAR